MKLGDLVRPSEDASWWGLEKDALGIIIKVPKRDNPHGDTYSVYFGNQNEAPVIKGNVLHFPHKNHQLEVVSESKE